MSKYKPEMEAANAQRGLSLRDVHANAKAEAAATPALPRSGVAFSVCG